MSERTLAQTHPANTAQAGAKDSVLLQRREREQAEQSVLQQWQIDTVSGTFAEPRFGYDFSRVSALTGMARQNRPLLRTQPMVQRALKDGAPDDVESEQTSAAAEPTDEAATPAPEATTTPVPSEPTEAQTEETATPEQVALPGLIVEDSATELSPGQMKKSEFLSQLKSEVCRTVDAALAGTGRTTDDCPYLIHWFDFYNRKESAYIERAIHRYAPETSSATTVSGYISVIAQKARQAAETWARTGEITGVPEGVPTTVPDETPTESGEGAAATTSAVMFKARKGGTRAVDNPKAIQAELEEGRPLDSIVRSRMESAFGMDFSHVRTHTDTTAAGLSNRLNARAFTVGEHVAFGSGEYRPETLFGDALIAHELAHVAQQSGTSTSVAPMEVGGSSYNALEEDADRSAIGAVVSLWRGAKESSANIAKTAIPRLRSGLKLQRCQRSSPTSATTTTPPTVSVGNFRNRGSTADSGENNCANCPRDLGIHATDFKNGMELRGDITGHIPQAQYDFKRTREGGVWKKVGGSWIQRFHDGPGQNDDRTDADEDLTPVNNHIYVEDIPGLGRDPSGGDASATEAVLKGSFVEWVNVRVGTSAWTKRSNEFEWHSISWVEKVGGNWRRKAGENEIETGSTTVGTGNP